MKVNTANHAHTLGPSLAAPNPQPIPATQYHARLMSSSEANQ